MMDYNARMTNRSRTEKFLSLAAIAALCIAAQASHAASLLYDFSRNGGVMQMDLSIGFRQPAGSLTTHGPLFSPVVPDSPAGSVFVQAPGAFLEMPASGAVKDIATITPKTRFSYGSPFGSGDDELTFEIDATLSAEHAFDAIGNPLDAEIHFTANFSFFVDAIPGIAPPGTFVGEMDFMDFRPLDAYESISLKVTELIAVSGASSTIASASALSSGPVTVPNAQIYSDRLYQIFYSFDAVVPHGIDPHYTTLDGLRFDYQGLGSLGVIPLPASVVLLVLPLVSVFAKRRTR